MIGCAECDLLRPSSVLNLALIYNFSLDSAKGHALGGRVGFKLVW